MEFSHLFEDLEAQFAAANSTQKPDSSAFASTPEGPVLAELKFSDGATVLLVAPTLGLDFLAGINQATGTIGAYSLSSTVSISFLPSRAGVSIELKKTGRDFVEFSQVFIENKFLVFVHFLGANRPARQGWLVGCALTLLSFVDSQSLKSEFFAVATIARIECCSVHN